MFRPSTKRRKLENSEKKKKENRQQTVGYMVEQSNCGKTHKRDLLFHLGQLLIFFYYLSSTSSHLVAEASHQDKHTDIRQVSKGIDDCSHRCSLYITGYLTYDRKASLS